MTDDSRYVSPSAQRVLELIHQADLVEKAQLAKKELDEARDEYTLSCGTGRFQATKERYFAAHAKFEAAAKALTDWLELDPKPRFEKFVLE